MLIILLVRVTCELISSPSFFGTIKRSFDTVIHLQSMIGSDFLCGAFFPQPHGVFCKRSGVPVKIRLQKTSASPHHSLVRKSTSLLYYEISFE